MQKAEISCKDARGTAHITGILSVERTIQLHGLIPEIWKLAPFYIQIIMTTHVAHNLAEIHSEQVLIEIFPPGFFYVPATSFLVGHVRVVRRKQTSAKGSLRGFILMPNILSHALLREIVPWKIGPEIGSLDVKYLRSAKTLNRRHIAEIFWQTHGYANDCKSRSRQHMLVHFPMQMDWKI